MIVFIDGEACATLTAHTAVPEAVTDGRARDAAGTTRTPAWLP
jgi:hypothetical protein